MDENIEGKDILEFEDFIYLGPNSILVKQLSLDPQFQDKDVNSYVVLEVGTLQVKATLHLVKDSILYNLVNIQGSLTPTELNILVAKIQNKNDAFLYPKKEKDPAVLKRKRNMEKSL